MKKIDYQNEIQESESALRALYKAQSHPKLQERCEILLWLKSGKVETMKAALALKGRSREHGRKLWKQYKEEGLSGLLRFKHKGQVSPLKDKQELSERLKTEGFSSVKEAQSWILQVYGLEYTENGLGNYFRANKIKLKTARPHHPKQDASKREAYKKNTRKN